ncbi:MAG: ADP-ribosylglycohydrolase family protein [Chloroflexia bacterium]
MSLNVASLKSRARGCLLAAACGDALGGPLEFMGPLEIERTHGEVRDHRRRVAFAPTRRDHRRHVHDARPGAQPCRERHARPHDVAQRWVRWMQSGPSDIGGTVSQALELIQDGTPWERRAR